MNNMIEQLMNEVEDWIMSRENVKANQEDVINLRERFKRRLGE